MTSEFSIKVSPMISSQQLHNIVQQHVLIYNPPFNLSALLRAYRTPHGRSVRVVVSHSTRNVQIVEPSITNHVLHTTVRAWMQHRPREPLPPRLPRMLEPSRPQGRGQNTGKECSICMETIYSSETCALACAHIFHRRCITRWLQESTECPVCRLSVAERPV